MKKHPKILLWAFSNTGGIRTFFNIYKYGFECDFHAIRSIDNHKDHSKIFCPFSIVKKNIFWYLYGFLYKIIPNYFYKLKSVIKIKSGVCLIKGYFDTKDQIIATDIITLIILKKSGYRNIVYYSQHDESILSKTNEYLYKKYSKYAYDSISLITNSSWLKQNFVTKFNLKSKICIPGVDYEYFSKREKESYKGKPTKLLALARPQEWKGTKVLINAFDKVKSHYPNIELILFGSFDIATDSSHRISFVKNISDDQLVDLYKKSDLTINPSFFESSPGPVIESLSCGTPVISTRTGVEDIRYFDEPNTLFEEKNEAELTMLLIKLINNKNNEYQDLCVKAYEHKSVSWETTVDNLYQSDIFLR